MQCLQARVRNVRSLHDRAARASRVYRTVIYGAEGRVSCFRLAWMSSKFSILMYFNTSRQE
eukprot:897735-Amphidinium_carterae.1